MKITPSKLFLKDLAFFKEQLFKGIPLNEKLSLLHVYFKDSAQIFSCLIRYVMGTRASFNFTKIFDLGQQLY